MRNMTPRVPSAAGVLPAPPFPPNIGLSRRRGNCPRRCSVAIGRAAGGVGPGSPPSDRATWGQPPKYVERKAECHDDTASPASGPSTRAAAANADMRAHPCPTHPCWAAQSKTCTSRGQSITRTRRDAQRPRKRASARPSPPDLVATHRRDRARRELA